MRRGTASLGGAARAVRGRGAWQGALPPSSTGTALTRSARSGPSELGGVQQSLGQRLLAFWLQLLGMAGGHWFSPFPTTTPFSHHHPRPTLATASPGPKEAGEEEGEGDELESETPPLPGRVLGGGGTVPPSGSIPTLSDQ